MIRALVTDLFFQVRIKTTAAACGRDVEFVSSPEALLDGLGTSGLVIVDLALDSGDPVEAIRRVKAAQPGLKVVGYGPHVQRERMREAGEQGADAVLPRSRFTAELADILNGVAD